MARAQERTRRGVRPGSGQPSPAEASHCVEETSAMPAAAVDVVQLKRRVRNAETELFEWRRCQCSVMGDGQLVLELVDDDDNGDEEGDGDGDATSTARSPLVTGASLQSANRVVVDLAWQLQSIEQKRKCKTRCHLQFTGDRDAEHTRSEELMAPSPRHCSQWVELVREAAKRAQRRQSIRQGTTTATATATSTAAVALSRSLSASSDARGSQSSAAAARSSAAPFDASASSVSAASRGSSTSFTRPTLSASQLKMNRPGTAEGRRPSDQQQKQQQRQAKPRRQQTRNRYDESESESESNAKDVESDESEQDREEEPPSPLDAMATAPLPRELFVRKLAAVRRLLPPDPDASLESTFDIDDSVEEPQLQPQRQQHEEEEEEEDEGEHSVRHRHRHSPLHEWLQSRTSSSSSESFSAPTPRRRRTTKPTSLVSSGAADLSRHSQRPRVLSLSSPSSSVSCDSQPLRRSTRRLEPSRVPALRRSQSARSEKFASAAAVAASIQRLRRRERTTITNNNAILSDDDGDDDGGLRSGHDGSREELDILLRVETALRQLERENALAKERESALAHQVSSLQDALRVRAAEKSHLERHAQQLARDKDTWKQAAQRAEHALAQLEDELAIVQEETQLQHSERRRLQHQNKELLAQVHRLDAIVYGRF